VSAGVLNPETARRWPGPSGEPQPAERIDPYHRDKVPNTPYEVRRAEMERDDHLAGRTGPSYPPLFKDQKQGEAEGGQ
jgi:hypothetical protein